MNAERSSREGTGLSWVGKQRGKDCEREGMVYDGDRGHCVGLSFLCAAYSGGLPCAADLGGWCSWRSPVS